MTRPSGAFANLMAYFQMIAGSRLKSIGRRRRLWPHGSGSHPSEVANILSPDEARSLCRRLRPVSRPCRPQFEWRTTERYNSLPCLQYLFLLFTVVPLVELALLIWIGGQTVWWLPIAMVVLTGIAGAVLARWQGLRALQRIQDDLQAGRMPADAVVDGVLILVAGILLVTPGVITDIVGVALLIPPLRSLMKRGAMAGYAVMSTSRPSGSRAIFGSTNRATENPVGTRMKSSRPR